MNAKSSDRRKVLAFLAMLFAARPTDAAADMLWNWSYINADTHIKAAGTLTTRDLASESYVITSVTGSWNGASITALAPLHSCCSPPGWNDNVLVPGETRLNKGGFAFDVSGGSKINLFYKDGHYAYEIQNGPEIFGGVFTATPNDER
ncbi:MAG TPA: hypothetical protein VIE66_05350 [Methylocella sp.]